MKFIITNLFFLSLTLVAQGQLDCDNNWPKKNLRPDTVTTFLFSTKSVKVTNIQNVKATSNFSFKNRFYDQTWIPIKTSDIKGFMSRSFKKTDKNKIIDTLNCKIFGQDHEVIVIKSKKKIFLIIYLNQSGEQDIFISTIHKKNNIMKTIEHLETNFW